MSRGLGRMQRLVMEALERDASFPAHQPEHWHPVAVVAWCIAVHEQYGSWDVSLPFWERFEADYVLKESVRRAVKTLAARGQVEVTRRYHLEHPDWNGWHCRLTGDRPVSVGQQPTLSPREAGELVEQLRAGVQP